MKHVHVFIYIFFLFHGWPLIVSTSNTSPSPRSIRLLKQLDSSLLSSLDADVQGSAASQTKISNGEDIILKSEVPNYSFVNKFES